MLETLSLWGILGILFIPSTILAIKEYRHRYKYNDHYQFMESEQMPEVLQKSTLFMSEQEIKLDKPYKLTGRIDQVFKTDDDVLILLDTKTRSKHETNNKDILQLSLYAQILRYSKERYKVADTAYIRTVVVYSDREKEVYYTPVKLYDDEKINELLIESEKVKKEEKIKNLEEHKNHV